LIELGLCSLEFSLVIRFNDLSPGGGSTIQRPSLLEFVSLGFFLVRHSAFLISIVLLTEEIDGGGWDLDFEKRLKKGSVMNGA